MRADVELWEQLCRLGARRRFRSGQHVIRRDDSTSSLVAVAEGLCKVVDGSGDGREALVAVRGPGEVIGELAALTGAQRSASVVALMDVEAVTVSQQTFDEWLDGTPGAARLVATMLAHRVAETSRPQVAAHHKVEARLAHRLLFLHERFVTDAGAETTAEIRVPLTHDDYASWIGATRAVTTRALGKLRDRGLIDHGRGWIRVLDHEGLSDFSTYGA